MKKIKIVQIIGLLLILTYISLFVSNLIVGYLKDLDQIVLSVVLICVSVALIFKGVLLKSSSTLWFAICLINFSILIIIFELASVDLQGYDWIFACVPLLASVLNLAVFKAKIYIKVIILNISILIPIVTTQVLSPNTWLSVIIWLVSVILGVFICRCINLDREKVWWLNLILTKRVMILNK